MILGILALLNIEGTVAKVDTTQEGFLKVQLATKEGERWVVLGPAGWMAERGFAVEPGQRLSVAVEGDLATSVSVRKPDGSVFVLPLRSGENLELKAWEREKEESKPESNLK